MSWLRSEARWTNLGCHYGWSLAVEELNLLDADDFARAKREYQGRDDERLTALICDLIRDMPTDVRGMYGSGIARAEAIFGRPLVCAFLGTIVVSTAGWREGDFRKLLPMLSGTTWDELQFASLRRIFRGQIRCQKPLERWNFVHSQMRVAVRTWLAEIGVDERSVHTAIVDHLLSLPADDTVRISEVMLHLMESEDWARAANYLGAVEDDQAAKGGALHVLVDALRVPTEHTAEDIAHRLSLVLNAEGIDDALRNRVATRVLEVHYGSQGRCSLAAQETMLVGIEDCLRRLVHKVPNNIGVLEQHARSLTWLGHLRKDQEDLEGALTSYRGAQAIRERIATLQSQRADKREPDPGNTLAVGDALLAQGDVEGALASYRYPANLERSVGHNRTGVALRMKGDFKGALASFRAGMAIVVRDLERNPRNQALRLNLGLAHSTIGTTLVAAGDLESALLSYRTGMEIVARVAEQTPTEPHVQSEWALMHYRIADVSRRRADYDGALTTLSRGMTILEQVVAQYPDNPQFARHLALFRNAIADVSKEWEGDEDLSSEIKRIIMDSVEGIAENEITPDARFVEDLGAAEWELEAIHTGLWDRFHIVIPGADAERITNVGQLVIYIRHRLETLPSFGNRDEDEKI
jgi:acyl carrier protein